ncbi:hypothetical protein [Staphylococcus phage vB_SauM-V1SA15]|nr:hypothetical protein [Staphylococcus phage vB_SauM-V1SA15]
MYLTILMTTHPTDISPIGFDSFDYLVPYDYQIIIQSLCSDI